MVGMKRKARDFNRSIEATEVGMAVIGRTVG